MTRKSTIYLPVAITKDERDKLKIFARSKGMTTMGLVGQLIKRELERSSTGPQQHQA